MSYEEAEAYLEDLGIDAMKSARPSTDRIEALCDVLDHPERSLQAIHVTGTNGKTSTARIAAALLQATGLSVGTYTSPHLESVRERISLNGEPLGEDEFGEVFAHTLPFIESVRGRLDERITYFETLTAMFLLWAAESVDVAVLEVGLGGRWDATNVVPASVGVVTNIALDHTHLMGDRPAIAKEKAGIAKPGMRLVTGERDPEILEIIRGEAEAAGAEVGVLGKDFALLDNSLALGGRYVSLASGGRSYDDLFLPLHGRHQGVNAALAVEAVTSFLPRGSLDPDLVAEGFAQVKVPGRLESLPPAGAEAAPVVLDVAHNPDGMSALVNTLQETFAFERVVFVIGVLREKDADGILREMARVPNVMIVTAPRSDRAMPATDLLEKAAAVGAEAVLEDDVRAAVRHAQRVATDRDLICITGSNYVVGEARPILVG